MSGERLPSVPVMPDWRMKVDHPESSARSSGERPIPVSETHSGLT